MMPTKTTPTLIYLIFLSTIFKCYTLGQSGLCAFDTNVPGPNICDHSNHLVYVSENTSGCRSVGNKCWCILIDNHNRYYDGDMVIELVQSFDRDDLHADELQYGEVKSYLKFKIVSGINRVLVQPYTPPDAFTNISSIKIGNNEVCRFRGTTSGGNDLPQKTNDDYLGEEYRYFSDCMRRSNYTDNSFKYCPTYTPEVMIEKRFAFNNQAYWCIVINNVNNLLTIRNRLHITYSSPNRYFIYSPSDAHIERGDPGSEFHLGNQETIIAISENNYQLANFDSVTIDNYPICSYFQPYRRIATPTPSRTFYTMATTPTPIYTSTNVPEPDQPAKLLIPANQSILNSNPDLVDYPPVLPDPFEETLINLDSSMKTCGIKPVQKNALISFGTNTSPGDWPWHAAIYKLQTKTNRLFICSGTLINRKTIVTAAHCVLDFDLTVIPERLTVELGRFDLSIASVGTQEYRVYDVIPHNQYKPDTFQNDIAILVLANYVQLTQYVHYICLPNMHVNLQNQVGTTVGWGRDHNNELQIQLKEAKLPVIDKIKCLSSNREFFKNYLTKTNFCAGFMNNTNVCRGDSGGGLVFKSNSQWFLGGITSVGVSSKSIDLECDLMQYVLFTDVTKFLPWIRRNS